MESDRAITIPSQEPSAKSPLVSLVIPVFNAARYFSECLESIASQSFTDFEVTIIDDGSSDNSFEIAEQFCQRDSRFNVIKGQHGGVSKARNLGINLSKGRYIGFVDADDCLHTEMLGMLVDTLHSTDSDVCVCAFDKGTRFIPKVSENAISPLVMDYATAMKEALYQRVILNAPCGMIMKRSLLGEDIRFREGIRYEDLDAFYRFYENAAKITYIPAKLYFYRQAEDSFMHKWSDSRLDALDVTDRIVDYMSDRHPDLLPAALDRRFSAHFNILLLMLKHDVRNDEAKSRCIDVLKKHRLKELRDKNVRLKNKLGALASFGGLPLLKSLTRLY